MKRIASFLLCLLLAFAPAVGAAEAADRAERMLTDLLNFKAAQSGADSVADWAADDLPATMGAGGEWYVLGLQQGGAAVDLTGCRAGLLDYLATHTVRAASTRQKLALTLKALGGGEDYLAQTLEDSIGQQGLMSWVWGLHLLSNGCESAAYPQEEVIRTILELRKADGGWAITGNAADVDATAMTLQALAPHREDAEVAVAIDGALTLLSARQLASGGFASYGVENAESTAQVIIALCAWQVDPFTDARFIKNGVTLLDALADCCLADGSFSHEKGGAYSESATAQAFLALTAYTRYQAGKDSLYLLDAESSAPSGEMMTVWNWQVYAAAAIGGAAIIGCIVLLLLGKRHPKNFLAVAIIAAAALAFVYFTDFQTADTYYTTALTKTDVIGEVTLTIRCDKVAGQAAHIPADGLILPETTMPIARGDTVYTLLTDAARSHGIHMEASGANGLMYIHGIGNIYEFDFGDLSGWVYRVNGESVSVGCDQVVLTPGDRIEWHYTLELGKDID